MDGVGLKDLGAREGAELRGIGNATWKWMEVGSVGDEDVAETRCDEFIRFLGIWS